MTCNKLLSYKHICLCTFMFFISLGIKGDTRILERNKICSAFQKGKDGMFLKC